MIQIEIFGKPHAWAPARASRFHHYDPKAKEKEEARWQIRAQYRDLPISGRIMLDFTFYFPIPKNTSYVKQRQMLSHMIVPLTKPDTTNLQKFYEDCLKSIVITDDNVVSDIRAIKRYSARPGIVIRILPLGHLADEEKLKAVQEIQKENKVDKVFSSIIKKKGEKKCELLSMN